MPIFHLYLCNLTNHTGYGIPDSVSLKNIRKNNNYETEKWKKKKKKKEKNKYKDEDEDEYKDIHSRAHTYI